MNTQLAANGTTETLQYASFFVDEMLLAIPISQVHEINRQLDVTRVPHAKDSIAGVINLRGEVVTVVDLRNVLGLPRTDISAANRNVIIQHGDELIGLMVDGVADILSIEKSDITTAPANVSSIDHRFIKGVYAMNDQIVVILDIDESLT